MRFPFLLLLMFGCAEVAIEAGEIEPWVAEADRYPEPDLDADDAAEDARVDLEVQPVSRFLGHDDHAWRRALAEEDVAHIELGGGGRSLGFRITLANGARGYFKPAQSFSAARWYSEVAAHHLDRELGFERAPPSVARQMYWPQLRRVARDDERVNEVEVDDDQMVVGAFIHWIEGGLTPWQLGQGWERWVRVEGGMHISPYQRPRDYRGLLNEEMYDFETEIGDHPEAEAEPEDPAHVGELSDLIVFDFLISNVDRWSGSYTNVRRRGTDGALVFLDNAAGFWRNERLGLMDARLQALQRFRRPTVEALERFRVRRFRERLATESVQVLDEGQIAGVEARRRAVLLHVRAMRQRFGERVFVE